MSSSLLDHLWPFGKKEEPEKKRTYAKLTTSVGELEVDFLEEDAPDTIKNFLFLVKQGFYNGRKFFRVRPGELVQTGCPRDDGSGDAGYHIRCELTGKNQVHKPGVLAMAHTGRNQGSSQFYICLGTLPQYNGNHTCFGQVGLGLELLPQLKTGDLLIKVEILTQVIKPQKDGDDGG
ncbi:MAG: peptidylprolyl isomerase [Bernardetiaceae bacterium]|jgi:peptidyl-prolyl cis-trans isomerase B (cyclophilin B)|nr:peptidylprolyl isomerase [Bernardetiaceae bacterium]